MNIKEIITTIINRPEIKKISLFFQDVYKTIRNKFGKAGINSKTIIDLAKPLLCGILIAILSFYSIKSLYENAKNNNVSLIDVRANTYILPYIGDKMPYNFIGDVFRSIFDAMDNKHSSQEIVKLKKKLFMDEDFAKGLHFYDSSDFLAYIYSLKGIDSDVKSYFEDVEKDGFLIS